MSLREQFYKIYLRASEGEDVHIRKIGANEFEVYKPDRHHIQREVTLQMDKNGLMGFLSEVIDEQMEVS